MFLASDKPDVLMFWRKWYCVFDVNKIKGNRDSDSLITPTNVSIFLYNSPLSPQIGIFNSCPAESVLENIS